MVLDGHEMGVSFQQITYVFIIETQICSFIIHGPRTSTKDENENEAWSIWTDESATTEEFRGNSIIQTATYFV